VSPNAGTAKLVSTGAELNVENISLNGQQAQPAAAPAGAPAQGQPAVVSNAAAGAQSTVQDAKDKAAATGSDQINRAHDSLNKALDNLFKKPATKK
jgi:hypothetical protein